MALQFPALSRKLQLVTNRLDEKSQNKLLNYLSELSRLKLPSTQSLFAYHETLLFICAHPYDKQQLDLTEKELNRIAATFKKSNSRDRRKFQNTGLPFTSFISNYSHDCLLWLKQLHNCHMQLVSQSDYSLNTMLALTLPSLELSYTTAGYSNKELLEVLKVKPSHLLSFFLSQFKSHNSQPAIKDYFFGKLDLEIKITPKTKSFSRAYNRVSVKNIYRQRDWIKQFNFKELIDELLPKANRYSDKEKAAVINCIKLTMALNDRETDPTTYLDTNSLRVYDLERGLTVAIYGMVPNRQLPIESYVGYTLFKNGFPAAYGGSWVFGSRANFGINIFEAFRGGESGYMMCQVLRVYKQVFQLSFFEIEPYQFGLDNREGLDSGAFWFYYRYGFRPLTRDLKLLAQKEYKKIRNSKSYRTPKTILKKFTESNLAINFDKSTPPALPLLTGIITKMIKQQFKGDRSLAVAECVHFLKLKSGSLQKTKNEAIKGLEDVALVTRALKVTDKKSIDLLTEMVKLKPLDLYAYSIALRKFLDNKKKW